MSLQDHPRIRGAYEMIKPIPAGTVGSSPHTRGLLNAKTFLWRLSRIIPAYAGPTDTILSIFAIFKDHPRIRGAYRIPTR